MKAFISGEFALKTLDGAGMGTLVAKETSAWGLSPFFSRRGGETGDYLLITFDLKKREALLCVGNEDVIEEYAAATDGEEFAGLDGELSEPAVEGAVPDRLQAELDRLWRENEILKGRSANGSYMKVSEKGALSVYGLGRYPLTLYRGQWERLLAVSDQIRSFIESNATKLKTKGSSIQR
jgi:hypothetical protein